MADKFPSRGARLALHVAPTTQSSAFWMVDKTIMIKRNGHHFSVFVAGGWNLGGRDHRQSHGYYTLLLFPSFMEVLSA